MINEVQYRHDRIVITKAGKPVAALIDMNLYERIRHMDDEFVAMSDELAQAFGAIPEPEGFAMVDEAVRAARGQPAE